MEKEEKIYSSYEEVNRDLEIYKLEMQLYREKMKSDFDDVKSELTFKNILAGFFNVRSSTSTGGSWLSKLLVSFAPWTTRLIWKIIR